MDIASAGMESFRRFAASKLATMPSVLRSAITSRRVVSGTASDRTIAGATSSSTRLLFGNLRRPAARFSGGTTATAARKRTGSRFWLGTETPSSFAWGRTRTAWVQIWSGTEKLASMARRLVRHCRQAQRRLRLPRPTRRSYGSNLTSRSLRPPLRQSLRLPHQSLRDLRQRKRMSTVSSGNGRPSANVTLVADLGIGFDTAH